MRLYLLLAWRNIWRNPKRTWITASSIAFAVFFACTMQSMQLGSYERMIDNTVRFYTGHLAIYQQDYWDDKVLDNSFESKQLNQLTLSEESILASVPRLSSFALASFKDHTKGVMVYGIDPAQEAKLTYLDQKVTVGTYLDTSGVMIAKGLADYLGMGVGDTLIMISQGYHGANAVGQFPVIGLLKFPVPELNQAAVYLHLSEAQHFYGASGLITAHSLLLTDPKHMQAVQATIAKDLAGTKMTVMNWEEMMPELLQGIELDYYGGLVMIYILYAVIGFGILGTFLMMTIERTYEFGILCAIGMKKPKIQLTITLEIIFLTFLGVFIGLTMSAPLIAYFYFNPIYFTGEYAVAMENFGYEAVIPFSIDPVVFYDQGIVVLILSLTLGLYPIYFIKNLRIIKALKE